MGRSLRAAVFTLILAVGSAHAVDLPKIQQPTWKELSAEQQRVLAPLQDEWDSLESLRRKKWLGIAARYPSMSEDEQVRLQHQMRDWAKLKPEQRKIAREKYKALRQAPPEQKAAVKQRWDAYNELSEEEKRMLQAAARPQPLPKPGTIMRKPPLTPAAAMLLRRTKLPTYKPQLSPAPSLVLPAMPTPAPAVPEGPMAVIPAH